MILSKTGAVAALKEAYKSGYDIIPETLEITICAGKWSIIELVREMPVEVSRLLVEHMGYLPTAPEQVRKNQANQVMMSSVVEFRRDTLAQIENEAVRMVPLPVIFREKWQLYRTLNGQVFAYDADVLAILDPDAVFDVFATPAGIGLWRRSNDEMLIVAPGSFGQEDRKKLTGIAALFAAPRIVEDEMPENLCLFDDLGGDDDE